MNERKRGWNIQQGDEEMEWMKGRGWKYSEMEGIDALERTKRLAGMDGMECCGEINVTKKCGVNGGWKRKGCNANIGMVR